MRPGPARGSSVSSRATCPRCSISSRTTPSGTFRARWPSADHITAASRSSPSLRETAALTGGTYRVELLWTVADDDHLVAVYRALGARPDGRELDVEQALLVELEEGRWKVVRAQPLDQAAFDRFWNG